MADFPALRETLLFRDIDQKEVEEIIDSMHLSVKSYKTGECIANEEDRCEQLGIVVEGMIELKKIFSSGKSLTLTQMGPGNVFGEALVFSKHAVYPATIEALKACKIVFISKEQMIQISLGHETVLRNFMTVLSEKILMLNRKITFLNMDSLKQKLAYYFLSLYSKQGSVMINLPVNRKQLSELMGVQRPSLSREFMRLKEDGIIDYDKNTVKIVSLEMLEELVVS